MARAEAREDVSEGEIVRNPALRVVVGRSDADGGSAEEADWDASAGADDSSYFEDTEEEVDGADATAAPVGAVAMTAVVTPFTEFASRTMRREAETGGGGFDAAELRRVNSWFLESEDEITARERKEKKRSQRATRKRRKGKPKEKEVDTSVLEKPTATTSTVASLLATAAKGIVKPALNRKMRSDTFGSKRLRDEDKTQWRMVLCHPASPHARTIARVVNILILAVAFVEPAVLAFRGERQRDDNLHWNEIIEIIFAVIFIADIALNFFRPVEKYSRLIWDKRIIAIKYLRGWFWIDVISSFPVDLSMNGSVSRGSVVARILSGLGLLRLLRLYRVRQMMSELERKASMPYFALLVIKFTLLIALSAHWSACMLYYIARMEDFDETSWVYAVDPDLPSMPFSDQYTTALYWAVVTLTTVGYGDISPRSNAERSVAMIIMILNMGVTAYILGNITQLVTKEDATIMAFRDNTNSLQRFMRRNDIPSIVRQKVDAHIQLEYEMGCRDDERVLNFCPLTIQSELRHALYQNYMNDCKVFCNVSPVFIQSFLECIKVEYFHPGTLLTCKDLDATAMYYLCLGKVDVVSEEYIANPCLQNKIETILPGEWLNITAVVCGKTCFHTSVVQSTCKLLVVSARAFTEIVRRFPQDAKLIMRVLLQIYRREMGNPDGIRDARAKLYGEFTAAIEKKRAELYETEMHDLTIACVTGDTAFIESALTSNPRNAHLVDAAGRSLLIIAVEARQIDAAKTLIKLGTDPNALTKAGFSALSRAVSVNSLPLVQLIVAAGGAFSEPDDHTVVHSAISQDQIQRLKLLIAARVNLHNQDYHGSTPLHVAARLGSHLALQMLLLSGVEDAVLDKDGRTAQDVAEVAGNPGAVKILKEWKTKLRSTRSSSGAMTATPMSP